MTMQIPDNLIYKGISHNLDGGKKICPFGGLKNGEIIREEFGGLRNCSALWRGYLATWVIDEHGWLKLSEITKDIFLDEDQVPKNLLYELYQGYDTEIKATWVSGTFEVSSGEVIGRCGMYINVYERYLNIVIENGKLIDVVNLSGEEWKVKNDCENKATQISGLLKMLSEGN